MKGLKLPRPRITNDQIHPKLLDIFYWDEAIDEPVGKLAHKRYVTEYELVYITYSQGGVEVNGSYFDVKEGDVLFRKPGQCLQGHLPFACYFIRLDITGRGELVGGFEEYACDNFFYPDYDLAFLNEISSLTRPRQPEEFMYLFREVLKVQMSSDRDIRLRTRGLLFELLIRLHDESLLEKRKYHSVKGKVISDLKLYIEDHLQEKLSLEGLSKIAGMSKAHFQKTFKKIQGESPSLYIQKRRVEKAKGMLVLERLSAIDIAVECGFESATYFSTVFRKHTNLSPSDYRKRYKKRIF